MGGNALKIAKTRRYQKEEFHDLWRELQSKLEEEFNTNTHLIVSYNNKESFGDMDVLILDREHLLDSDGIKNIIKNKLGATEIYKNSNIYSFDYKELQIDLIFTPEHNWETSKVFFAYNDLGNFMGKLFYNLELKYGFNGLSYVYRVDNNRVLEKFIISKDMPKIFRFIGLSWEKFERGFDSLEDIFEYVISSPYFNPKNFYLENLNQKNRKRNKNRKNYNLLVKYITEKYAGEIYKEYDKSNLFNEIHDWFKDDIDFLGKIEELKEEEKKRIELKNRYNGHLIMETIPGLNGKELGIFKHYHENSVSCFEDFILSSNESQIKESIIFYYSELPLHARGDGLGFGFHRLT